MAPSRPAVFWMSRISRNFINNQYNVFGTLAGHASTWSRVPDTGQCHCLISLWWKLRSTTPRAEVARTARDGNHSLLLLSGCHHLHLCHHVVQASNRKPVGVPFWSSPEASEGFPSRQATPGEEAQEMRKLCKQKFMAASVLHKDQDTLKHSRPASRARFKCFGLILPPSRCMILLFITTWIWHYLNTYQLRQLAFQALPQTLKLWNQWGRRGGTQLSLSENFVSVSSAGRIDSQRKRTQSELGGNGPVAAWWS